MDIQINYDYRKEDLEKLPLHELTQFVLARDANQIRRFGYGEGA